MRAIPVQRQITVRFRGRRIGIAEANALATREFALNNFEAALELYDLLAAKSRDNAEIHNNRGAVLQQLKRYPEALTSYEKALKLKPGNANVYHNRGTTLNKLKRHEEAVAEFDRAITLKPDHAEAYHNRGVALQELKRYDEALASYGQALAIQPNHAEASNNSGLIFSNQGNMPKAEMMFLKAAAAKPDFTEPLFNLTTIRHYENSGQADVKQIRTMLDNLELPVEDRECLFFCLGKIFDDCRRYDEAFDFYRQANALRNARVRYDPAKVEALVSGIINVFDADFLARPFANASDSKLPVFVVGMPRAGTTLLAGILSSHQAIGSAGELSTLTDLTERLGEITGAGIPFPQGVRRMHKESASRLTSEYLWNLSQGISLDKNLVVDKNPFNFLNIGLITLLFPKAQIIHCQRAPMDTCLSTYFQRFSLKLDYAFDLHNIGHYYGQYDRLMQHWRKMSTVKLHEISYEDMVSQTESSVRRALDFLGLKWDDRCLKPQTNPAFVETASRWQVRQPIYQRSVKRWQHYEKHLAPLKEALIAAHVAV